MPAIAIKKQTIYEIKKCIKLNRIFYSGFGFVDKIFSYYIKQSICLKKLKASAIIYLCLDYVSFLMCMLSLFAGTNLSVIHIMRFIVVTYKGKTYNKLDKIIVKKKKEWDSEGVGEEGGGG